MDFKFYALDEALELIIDHRGKTPKKMGFEDFQTRGVPVLSAKHVKTDKLVNIDQLRFADREMYEKWMKEEVAKGDIVLTSEAPLGEVFYINSDQKYVAGQRVFVLRTKKEILSPLYLVAWLTSEDGQKKLNQRASGSTVLGIKQSELRKIEVPVPNLLIQNKIAKFRYDFTKKIELNNQINDTLEAMAQAIFKSWFVDFDPVHAKAKAKADGLDAEGINRAAMAVIASKSDAELAKMKADSPAEYEQLKTLASLFPAQLEESELGLIPQGWEVSSLSDLIIITGGGTPKRSEPSYWNGDIPWFSIKDLPKKNVFVINTEEKITEAGLKKSSTKLLEKGTTIITARGTVGELALLAIDSCMNQSCYGIRGKDFGDFFNYFNLKQAVHTLKQNVHGAVFDTITTKTFDTYHLPYSGSNLAIAYEDFVTPLMLKVNNNNYQNQTLTELRDALLPKLLSGEIEV